VTRPVVWSRDALDDLKSQAAYIARRNRRAAQRVAKRIREAGEALGEKATGRRGRVAGTYEKSVTGLPYVLAYALRTLPNGLETIVVLRVVHTARDWPPGSLPP